MNCDFGSVAPLALRATLGLAVAASLTGSALAQTAFGTQPGENSSYIGLEQRFNQLQYHATHNSYQRDEGIAQLTAFVTIQEQLDGLNVWSIELDVRWSSDANDFYVFHSCIDEQGSDTLDNYLQRIAASIRMIDSFTYVDLETTEIGPCFLYPSIVPKPNGWNSMLRDKVAAYFGSKVYTQDNFRNDDYKWPSAQELIRRGKHIAFQIKGPDTSNNHLDYFFAANGIHNDPGVGGDNESLNTTDENKVITPGLLEDRRMARHYPSVQTCSAESSSEFSTAVGNGFTFSASNCSEQFGFPALHPPLPTYVNLNPLGSSAYGTWRYPYHGASGILTVFNSSALHANASGPSMIAASIESGTYDVTPGGPMVLGGPIDLPFGGSLPAGPVRLTTRGGIVTIK